MPRTTKKAATVKVTTGIKVEVTVRSKLRVLAAKSNLSLIDYLSEVAKREIVFSK